MEIQTPEQECPGVLSAVIRISSLHLSGMFVIMKKILGKRTEMRYEIFSENGTQIW